MKILMALLFMPMAAFAADWVLIGATQEFEIEIDRQSVRPGKAAWFKYINTPPASESCTGTGKKMADSKSYIEANCKEFTIRTKQRIAYSEDGLVLEYCGYNDPKAAFTEYAPETVGEIYFKAICDPKSRMENRLATWIRKTKAEQAEEAARQSRINQLREERRTSAVATPTDTRKPWGAQCTTSSECYGTLVCARVDALTMQCMSSDAAIRLNQ